MICECEFDPKRDIHDVDQFGFIDLIECLANGEVPSSIAYQNGQ